MAAEHVTRPELLKFSRLTASLLIAASVQNSLCHSSECFYAFSHFSSKSYGRSAGSEGLGNVRGVTQLERGEGRFEPRSEARALTLNHCVVL